MKTNQDIPFWWRQIKTSRFGEDKSRHPVLAGAIIGDGDRKSWDARGPMIWDNFSIFRTNSCYWSWACCRIFLCLESHTNEAKGSIKLTLSPRLHVKPLITAIRAIAPSWRHLSALIHARVVGSRVDVVTLRDQMLRVARFSCRFLIAMAGNKEPGLFYVLLCSWSMERWVFRVENFFNFALWMNNICSL